MTDPILTIDGFVKGMDSSRWEDVPETSFVPNFQLAYDRGMKFNYLKASQNTWTDSCFKRDWANCRKTPMLLGAYHFMTWDAPKPQAEYFWNLIKSDPGELPPMVDFEWWSVIPLGAYDILYNFVERFKQISGIVPGIYTADGFWKQYGTTASYWAECPLWIAHYNSTPPVITSTYREIPKPWDEFFLWQHSGKGDGLYLGMESKDVDLDQMPVKFFDKYSGGVIITPPLPEEPPTPPVVGENANALKMKVLVSKLNIRSGPGVAFGVIGQLNKDETVTVYDVAGKTSAFVKISGTENKWSCVEDSWNRYLTKI